MSGSNFSVTTPNGVVQTGDTVVARIQNRRGLKANLPQPLYSGEFGWCVDTKELFLGIDADNATSVVSLQEPTAVQTLLDDYMMEFHSKWSYLNSLEVEDVDNYSVMEAKDFFQYGAAVSSIEDNVEILNQFKTAIDLYVPSPLKPTSRRITTTRQQDVKTAYVDCTIVGGIITAVAISSSAADKGIGYLDVNTVKIRNNSGGVAATVSVTTTGDGQGIISSVALVSGGSGYSPSSGTAVRLPLEAPVLEDLIATADVPVIIGGVVDSCDIILKGDEYRIKPVVEVIGGNPSNPAVIEAVWNASTRQIDALTVISGGSGYTSAPLVRISAPISRKIYQFTYTLGLPNAVLADITAIETGLNATTDSLYPSTGLLASDGQAMVYGSGGLGVTVVTDTEGNSTLNANSAQQAAAIANMLNEINTFGRPLAISSQNVEILTEFSTLPSPSPSVTIQAADMVAATLTPTATWEIVQIEDVNSPGSFIDMAFDPLVSNSVILNYSAKHAGSENYLGTGSMSLVVHGGETKLSYSGSEIKESPALDSAELFFMSDMDSGNAVVKYRHNFPSAIELKYISTDWLA